MSEGISTSSALDIMHNLLKAHGLDSTEREGWLFVEREGAFTGLSAEIHPLNETEAWATVQLEVRVLWMPERMIVETFAGGGSTPEDAIRNAVEKFTGGVFHVLLAAVWGVVGEDRVHLDRWEDQDGVVWKIWHGDVMAIGLDDETSFDAASLIRTVRDQFLLHDYDSPANWVRTFFATLPNGEHVIEVALNNAPWEAGQAQVEKLVWPPSTQRCLIRWFCVMLIDEEASGL